MADAPAPQLPLSPDRFLRTRVADPTPADARPRPPGVARLSSRTRCYLRANKDGTKYGSFYVDTFVPPAPDPTGVNEDPQYKTRYIGSKATVIRSAGDDVVLSFPELDTIFFRDDMVAMETSLKDTGIARLQSSSQYSGGFLDAAQKKKCFAALQPIVFDEDIYVKACRNGVKVITLRNEFDDDESSSSETKTVVVRSPSTNKRASYTVHKLLGKTVDVIVSVRYRVVLNLSVNVTNLRQDIMLHSVYETDHATNAEDDDPAVQGFDRSSDYEEQLTALLEPERGTRRNLNFDGDGDGDDDDDNAAGPQ